VLDVPPDHDLRRCHAVCVGDLDQRRVPKRRALERAVALQDDVALAVGGQLIGIVQGRAPLDLEDPRGAVRRPPLPRSRLYWPGECEHPWGKARYADARIGGPGRGDLTPDLVVELRYAADQLCDGRRPNRTRAVGRFLPQLVDLIWNGQIDPGKVFDLTLPLRGGRRGLPSDGRMLALSALLARWHEAKEAP
jgi:hypothetical protein